MAPYLLWPQGTARDQAYLLGVLCSMPLDWCARRVIERHVTYNHFNSLPIPRAEAGNPYRLRTVEVAGRLATAEPDHTGFRDWAAEVGVEPGSVHSEAEKQDLIAELDAVVAHLYGLDEDDLAVIYDTFHAGADYSERQAQVLQHFRDWRKRVEPRNEDGG
jgi:phenylpyruvate tautomerase PptA (4-oxalocrotonate tautomerase family)